MVIDANLSFSRARFTGNNLLGNYVPGSMPFVALTGVSFDRSNWFGSVRMRHIG